MPMKAAAVMQERDFIASSTRITTVDVRVIAVKAIYSIGGRMTFR